MKHGYEHICKNITWDNNQIGTCRDCGREVYYEAGLHSVVVGETDRSAMKTMLSVAEIEYSEPLENVIRCITGFKNVTGTLRCYVDFEFDNQGYLVSISPRDAFQEGK